MTGIYKIQNLINGKIYIGQSSNIEKRWSAHRTRAFNPNSIDYDKVLYKAFRKYKLNNFSFTVIEVCEKEQLNEKEIFWINYYNSNNPEKGYNVTAGGNCATYTVLTEEQVEEIRNLLQNTTISQQELANSFNVEQKTISCINTGETWIKEYIEYPIRKREVLKNFCACGVEITKNAKQCAKCARISQRIVERPSKEQLKEELFNSSFLAVGRKYGVSDNAIRKWCKAYGLSTRAKDYKNIPE